MPESEPPATAPAALTRKRSRTVANLSEQQIRHKRDVDRRAQRASRQRNKDCIARLEQQYLQLQETSRDTEAQLRRDMQELHAQNQSLLQCLDKIVDLASAATSAQPYEATASEGAESHLSDSQCHGSAQSSHVPHLDVSTIGGPSAVEGTIQGTDSSSPRDAVEPASPGASSRPEHLAVHINAHEAAQNTATLTPASNMSSGVREQPHSVMDSDGFSGPFVEEGPASVEGLYHALDRAGPLSPMHDHLRVLGTTVDIGQSRHADAPAMPTPRSATTVDSRSYGPPKSVCAVLPAHLLPTCPLDEILHDFISGHREMLSQGIPLEVVVGPEKPTAKNLINPELHASVHSISKVLSEVLSTFPYVHQPEKLAFFFVMYKTMRWQISSTKEDYMAMPIWLRPTVTQIAVPHAAWIDNIPWPGVRDILIENPEQYPFELFSKYYSQNVTVNWPFDSLDTISDVSGEALLHSIFEKHICNIKNWTVSSEFRSRFPDMDSAIYPRH